MAASTVLAAPARRLEMHMERARGAKDQDDERRGGCRGRWSSPLAARLPVDVRSLDQHPIEVVRHRLSIVGVHHRDRVGEGGLTVRSRSRSDPAGRTSTDRGVSCLRGLDRSRVTLDPEAEDTGPPTSTRSPLDRCWPSHTPSAVAPGTWPAHARTRRWLPSVWRRSRQLSQPRAVNRTIEPRGRLWLADA